VCVFDSAAVRVGFVTGEVSCEIAPYCTERDKSLAPACRCSLASKTFVVCGCLPLGGSGATVQIVATCPFPHRLLVGCDTSQLRIFKRVRIESRKSYY
jgi:hypothetical protein